MIEQICADMTLYLKDLKRKFNLIIVDMPFGTTALSWDIFIPLEIQWALYEPILADRGVIAFNCSFRLAIDIINSKPGWFRHEWAVDGVNHINHLNVRYGPLNVMQYILIFGESNYYNPQYIQASDEVRKRREKGDLGKTSTKSKTLGAKKCSNETFSLLEKGIEFSYKTNLIRMNSLAEDAANEYRINETQKRLDQIALLIDAYCPKGGKVLESFGGSMGGAIISHDTNRDYLGIEKRESQWKSAVKRLELHKANLPQPRKKEVSRGLFDMAGETQASGV